MIMYKILFNPINRKYEVIELLENRPLMIVGEFDEKHDAEVGVSLINNILTKLEKHPELLD